MKKFLPKTANNTSGFTLIELLTVVAIIAILSVIAITIFSGTQRNARDGARRSEVKAIANALEVTKLPAGYQPLVGTGFASGSVPLVDSQSISYCISVTASVANPTAAWAGTSCPTNYVVVSTTVPAANSAQFKVCSILENPSGVFCLSSAQ